MRRFLGLLVVLAPALAHAQPGATEPVAPGSAPIAPPMTDAVAPPSDAPLLMQTDPSVLSLARGARSAAVRGDCVGARILGSRIARMDPEFHRTVIRTDPAITQCKPATRAMSIEAQAVPDGRMQRREGTPPLSGGQLVGQFIVGGLFTLGGAVGGAFLGAGTGNCDDDCFGGIIVGGFIGGTVMAAVGVNLVGDTDEVEGSFGVAVAGSMLTTLVSIGFISKAEFDDETAPLLLLMSAPAVGAMIGFNLSREYKDIRVSVHPTPAKIGTGVGLAFASGTF